MTPSILLAEDEPGVAMAVSDRLENEGYKVQLARDGEEAMERASGGGFDLLILDVMMPKKSGFDVCKKLRQNGNDVPILMLTARGQVVDKVVGLQIGADDYVTKPFDMMELLARVDALLRRSIRMQQPSESGFRFGRVRVDFRSAEVFRDDEPVTLSSREYQLLRYLIANRGAIISRDQLLTEVWGYNAVPSTRTVDVHMVWLRQKLEDNPKTPQYFLTLRGLGYKFTA